MALVPLAPNCASTSTRRSPASSHLPKFLEVCITSQMWSRHLLGIGFVIYCRREKNMVADVHFALMANYFSFTLAFLHIFAHVLHHSMSIVLCEVFRVFAQSSIQIFLDCFLLIRIFLY